MKLHRETFGAAGPDFVFLHGWAMHGGFWRELAEPLAANRRVTLLDLPGHGRSGPPEQGYTLARVADSVAAALPAPGVVLIGWSLGGLIALEIALRHRGAIRELVLIGSTPQFTRSPDWPCALESAVFEEFATRLHAEPQATVRRFLALQVRGSNGERRILSRLKHTLGEAPAPHPTALSGGLEILRSASLRGRLAEIDRPVTIIHGTRDTLIPAEAAAATAAGLPDAVLHSVAGAGHAPFLSHRRLCLAPLQGLPRDC